MVVLAGDIGGTNARLAFYECQGEDMRELATQVYPTVEYPHLQAVIERFTQDSHLRPEACCLGVAGPVQDGRAQITNLPWSVDTQSLVAATGATHSYLLNDLEAIAYGLFTLHENDFVTLQKGEVRTGNACVIAAGTGLGEAGIVWTGERHLPLACEGGHATFAPSSRLEAELWDFLFERLGHVSWERLVSGMGLANIYAFTRMKYPEGEPDWLREKLGTADAASWISQAGVMRASRAAELAIELFVTLYAAEAGNLALKLMARGGVYLAGGIAPKLIEQLQHPRFLQSFLNKGRMSELLKCFPVKVVTNPHVSLRGAAWFAMAGPQAQTPRLV